MDRLTKKLSPEAVIWAYRLFLDREPENDDVIESKLMFLETTEELRAHLMGCTEFQEKNSVPLIPKDIDALPFPPAELIHLVAGAPDPIWFFAGGRKAFESMGEILDRSGVTVNDLHAVLDFGCGCGRVARHWNSVKGPSFAGTDYNPDLVAWCNENLPFGRFSVNNLVPPLGYADQSFDFVYALSVFTHLPENLQGPWVEEMARILTTGGVLLITVHGSHYIDSLNKAEQKQFRQGRLVVREEDQAGTNVCGAYHPPAYLRQGVFKKYFTVLDHIERGARGNPFQDAVLLRKR